MTAEQYKDAIRSLGWNQVEAARRLGIHPRTSRRYAKRGVHGMIGETIANRLAKAGAAGVVSTLAPDRAIGT
jgi:hypothetical protein